MWHSMEKSAQSEAVIPVFSSKVKRFLKEAVMMKVILSLQKRKIIIKSEKQ